MVVVAGVDEIAPHLPTSCRTKSKPWPHHCPPDSASVCCRKLLTQLGRGRWFDHSQAYVLNGLLRLFRRARQQLLGLHVKRRIFIFSF